MESKPMTDAKRDIVERLEGVARLGFTKREQDTIREAAAEIERLRILLDAAEAMANAAWSHKP